MGYNASLAVGLAVGVPCFCVLVICILLYLRRRRVQRQEDLEDGQLDLELRENGSFKEFGEALHHPVNATPAHKHDSQSILGLLSGLPQNLEKLHDTTFLALKHSDMDLQHSAASHASATSHTTGLTHNTSKTNVSVPLQAPHTPRQSRYPRAPGALETDPRSLGPDHRHAVGGSLPRNHGRLGSLYVFYDTFIPILPAEGPAAPDLQQPRAATDRHSVNLSYSSLPNAEVLSRSLDSLAKQLQNPQFFEKLPSRAATASRPRGLQQLSVSGSLDRLEFAALPEKPVDGSPAHPYRQRVALDNFGKPALTLENNFDNNIAADAHFESETDVVFR